MKKTASNARKTITFLKVHNTPIPDELIQLAESETHSSPHLNDIENEIYQQLVDWNGRIIINNDPERHALRAINQYYLDYPPKTMFCYNDPELTYVTETIKKYLTFPYEKLGDTSIPINNASYLFVLKNLESWSPYWTIIRSKWNCTIVVTSNNGTNSLRMDLLGFTKYGTILRNINNNLYNLYNSAIESYSKKRVYTSEIAEYLKMLGILYIS